MRGFYFFFSAYCNVSFLSVKFQSTAIVYKDPSKTLRHFCQWAADQNSEDDRSTKHFDYAAFMERHVNEYGNFVGGGMFQ